MMEMVQISVEELKKWKKAVQSAHVILKSMNARLEKLDNAPMVELADTTDSSPVL